MILSMLLIREFFKNKTKEEEQKHLLKIMEDYELMLEKLEKIDMNGK